jgi:IS30 family transposase
MCQADRKWQGLYKYLKHGRRYRKRGHVHTKRGNIINRVWIDQRPPIVGTRSRLGDAEADIILGKNRQPGLLVVLDRKSRKTWLRKLKTKEAGYVIDKIKDVCSKSTHRIKTITLDNDQSFASIEYFLRSPFRTPGTSRPDLQQLFIPDLRPIKKLIKTLF